MIRIVAPLVSLSKRSHSLAPRWTISGLVVKPAIQIPYRRSTACRLGLLKWQQDFDDD